MADRQGVGRQRLGQRLPPLLGSIPGLLSTDSLPAMRWAATHQQEDEAKERVALPTGELEGVYIISVAARLLEMHPQTLRKYERVGLVSPSRTVGMLRLYSEQDITRLRLIKYLVDDLRMNLAGVEFALGMLNRLLEVRQRLAAIELEEGLREKLGQELELMRELLDATFPNAE